MEASSREVKLKRQTYPVISAAKPVKPNEIPAPGKNPETIPSEEPSPYTWPQKAPEIKPGREPLTTPAPTPPEVPPMPEVVTIVYDDFRQ